MSLTTFPHAPSWIRTSGLPLRRGTLYPTELPGRFAAKSTVAPVSVLRRPISTESKVPRRLTGGQRVAVGEPRSTGSEHHRSSPRSTRRRGSPNGGCRDRRALADAAVLAAFPPGQGRTDRAGFHRRPDPRGGPPAPHLPDPLAAPAQRAR